jgi:hypothetical protein
VRLDAENGPLTDGDRRDFADGCRDNNWEYSDRGKTRALGHRDPAQSKRPDKRATQR